jgi:AraC-like DNA-binding protein
VLEEHPAAAAADARRGIVSEDVKRLLTVRVHGGDTRIESVSRELAMAPRTLQRKLDEEGLTYHALVEETRKAAAVRHLGDRRLSISEIAYLLGYSEPAAFHRAFKRWHGVSPQTFRGTLM